MYPTCTSIIRDITEHKILGNAIDFISHESRILRETRKNLKPRKIL